jgi:hypothetical protein
MLKERLARVIAMIGSFMWENKHYQMTLKGVAAVPRTAVSHDYALGTPRPARRRTYQIEAH